MRPVSCALRMSSSDSRLDDEVLVGQVGHPDAEVEEHVLRTSSPASLLMQHVPSMPLSNTAVMPERARPS